METKMHSFMKAIAIFTTSLPNFGYVIGKHFTLSVELYLVLFFMWSLPCIAWFRVTKKSA